MEGANEDLSALLAQLPLEQSAVVMGVVKESTFCRAPTIGGEDLDAWRPLKTLKDVEISRQLPQRPERVYKMRGEGFVRADQELLLQMVGGLDDVANWDPLYKAGQMLCPTIKPAAGVEVDLVYARYSLGAGPVCADRDFVYREVRVHVPGKMSVVACRSASYMPTELTDPVKRPLLTVRGQIVDSGWVIRPEQGGCKVTYVAQVDPKGWVPAFVVNLVSTELPLALASVRKLAEERMQDSTASGKLLKQMGVLVGVQPARLC